MIKLIRNKISDFTFSNQANANFAQLFDEAYNQYKESLKKSSIYKKARVSSFTRFLSFYAHKHFKFNIFFSEKDVRRLKNPQKGVHTKHSFRIICVLLKYIGNYDPKNMNLAHIIEYINEMDDNVITMKNVIDNPNIIVASKREEILRKIGAQETRINYYIGTKVIL